MSRVRIFALVTVLAVTLALTASPPPLSRAEMTSADDTARTRAVHAVPGAPNVDIEIDSTRVFTDVAYESVTNYVPLLGGPHLVEVFISGLPHLMPVFSTVVTITAGSDFSVAADGTVGSITGTLFIDDNSAPPPGQSRVRFIHLSPQAPAVDVGIEGGPVLFSGIAFPQASGYLPVHAGTYTLSVYLSGTITPVLSLPDVTFEDGAVHTLFAMGLIGGMQPLDGVLSTDARYSFVFLPIIPR
jgi:hypothetical protein